VKHSFLLLILLAVSASLHAQTPTLSTQFCPVPPVDSTLTAGQAARDNLWPGFGTGSRRQADMSSARVFKTVDFLGVTLGGIGLVGLTATAIQHNAGVQMFSTSSNVGYYVFGGMAAAGITTLVISRIKAVRQAREYDLFLFPAAVPGGAGLALNFQF